MQGPPHVLPGPASVEVHVGMDLDEGPRLGFDNAVSDEAQSQGFNDLISDHLLLCILDFLPAASLPAAALVGRRWRELCGSQVRPSRTTRPSGAPASRTMRVQSMSALPAMQALWRARLPPAARARADGDASGAGLRRLYLALFHTNLLLNPFFQISEQVGPAPGNAP